MGIRRLRILSVIWLLLSVLYSSPASQEVKQLKRSDKAIPLNPPSKGDYVGNSALVITATKYIGVTEHGYNRGEQIEKWQRALGGKAGQSYCGYFVGNMLNESKSEYPTVRSGMAQKYRTGLSIRPSHVAKGYVKIRPGWLLIWANYTSNGHNKGTGHIGINERQIDNFTFQTIEANTSSGDIGSQDNGDGVWRRQRKIIEKGKFRLIAITPSW